MITITITIYIDRQIYTYKVEYLTSSLGRLILFLHCTLVIHNITQSYIERFIGAINIIDARKLNYESIISHLIDVLFSRHQSFNRLFIDIILDINQWHLRFKVIITSYRVILCSNRVILGITNHEKVVPIEYGHLMGVFTFTSSTNQYMLFL